MQGSDSPGGIPKVQIIDGKVVQAPGTPPVAMIWLPVDGQVIAKVPAMRGNRAWVKNAVRIRSPRLVGDRWELPRSCLTKFVTAAVDRFGYVAVWRDMSRLSRCTKACLEATGMDCDCSCMGAHHGQDSVNWFEQVGDVVVAELGEITRSIVLYQALEAPGGGAEIYEGQLEDRQYCVDRKGRADWPKAAQFMCAGCLSRQARVWDHCHRHGYVRAPLCNTCNTRHWGGWDPSRGRPTPSSNLDTSYYRWCPGFDDEWAGFCSP